jgi:uncharacterized OB-fold protein
VTRPLPELSAQNGFFWTAGADGVLRIQECRNCEALIHPPQPVCRYCRSRDMGVRDVSGKATLSAFTVNHRFGFPDLPPPYVVAQVAVVEDPRVRLTTNIVECEPDDLELGQTVEVTFEKIEDVWLPLFRPTAEKQTGPLPTDEIAPTEFGRFVSAPLTTAKFEEHSAITGVGASRLGRRLMVPPLSLTIDACEAAVADAGLTLDDIDGLSTYPGLDIAGMGEGGVTALEGALGIRPTWINGGMDTFGPGGSIIAAMMAIATGMARQLADAVRSHLSSSRAGTQRAEALSALWDDAGDAGLDRVEPTRQCCAEPDGDLPRPDDHGRLLERQADHDAVRALRL